MFKNGQIYPCRRRRSSRWTNSKQFATRSGTPHYQHVSSWIIRHHDSATLLHNEAAYALEPEELNPDRFVSLRELIMAYKLTTLLEDFLRCRFSLRYDSLCHPSVRAPAVSFK